MLNDRIFWLDPTNTNPHFLELTCRICRDHGFEVTVRSNQREGYGIPPGVQWENFLCGKQLGSLVRVDLVSKMALFGDYVRGWQRAAQRILSSGITRVLFSTSLRLAWVDALFVRSLHRAGVNIVLVLHRPYYDATLQVSRRKPIAIILNNSNVIIVLSDYIRQFIHDHFAVNQQKVQILPHPHYRALLESRVEDTATKKSLAEWRQGRLLIAYMSSIDASHGIEDFVDMVPLVENHLDNACFLLMGNDQLKGQSPLAKKAERLLADKSNVRCRFGFYTFEEAKAVLRQTSVLVLPYRTVPQSGIIPMAAGEGVPVVATRVGGLPEMIINGRNGELVEPGNLTDLTDKTIKVVSLAKDYRARTKIAAEELFSPEVYCHGLTSTVRY
jgi:glycosyltransferase involved in cell wall biosynthesis